MSFARVWHAKPYTTMIAIRVFARMNILRPIPEFAARFCKASRLAALFSHSGILIDLNQE